MNYKSGCAQTNVVGNRDVHERICVDRTRAPRSAVSQHRRRDRVAPSGLFLYGSNRGHDSVVTFAIDKATGGLTPIGWEPTQGTTPRFFALDPTGTHLYAANQNSDTVVIFRVDQTTGKLTATNQIVKVASPTTIVFR